MYSFFYGIDCGENNWAPNMLDYSQFVQNYRKDNFEKQSNKYIGERSNTKDYKYQIVNLVRKVEGSCDEEIQ